jgi:hypothetical protein
LVSVYLAAPRHVSVPGHRVVAGVAELPLQLWLIVMGVNNKRWTEQALAAGMSEPEWS